MVKSVTGCGSRLENLHQSPYESLKAIEREHSAWGYNWASLVETAKYGDGCLVMWIKD
jgi:hypothetical protein